MLLTVNQATYVFEGSNPSLSIFLFHKKMARVVPFRTIPLIIPNPSMNSGQAVRCV